LARRSTTFSERLSTLRKVPKRNQRLLERGDGFPMSRVHRRLAPSPIEVRDGLVPHLAAERVMSETLDLLFEPRGSEPFHRQHDLRMEVTPSLTGQASVGHFVSQRVLEGVLGLREEARLVEKLSGLKPRQA